ncbi:glycosyltransferase family 4 protein [Bacteroidota bacterium]|nr:glycosyltransferase family 4 protein [Bacteroidota bacterium]
MKILFLTDNFPPESNAPAIRTYEHCVEWVSLGHEITVITCAPNFPSGKVFDGYKNKLFSIENMNGIKVIRVWSYISPNRGFTKRILDYVSYGISSFVVGLFLKTDLIIGTSPQFFTALSAKLLSFCKKKDWIMEVRDLWPDSIVAVGSLSNKTLAFKFLKYIEGRLYHSAKKIVVVTDSFKKYLIEEHSIKDKKIGVFKNGINLDLINDQLSFNSKYLRTKHALNDKILISYAGTIGLAHAIRFILDATQKITNNNIHFLFIGDGAERDNLIEYSKSLKKRNITFLKSVSREEAFKYISMTDFSLVNLKKSDEFLKVIPSKIFENIAHHKPILLGLNGEAEDLIKHYDVGVCFDPENTGSFLNAIEKVQEIDLTNFKTKCQIMLKDFNRKKIAQKMLDFIKN